MKKVDLNVDIGEGFPYDEALLEFATSVNVCCGEHAGSWELTLDTIELCKRKGTRIGMHPGFPDRASMGRAVPEGSVTHLLWSLYSQCKGFMAAHRASYVKPHGAFYNLMCSSEEESEPELWAACGATLIEIVENFDVPVMILPVAAPIGDYQDRPIIAEGFADRAYQPDGTLVPRTEPGAVLEDPEQIKEQVLRLAPEVDSICLHGDTPGCLEFAQMVRKTLEDAGYEVAA